MYIDRWRGSLALARAIVPSQPTSGQYCDHLLLKEARSAIFEMLGHLYPHTVKTWRRDTERFRVTPFDSLHLE